MSEELRLAGNERFAAGDVAGAVTLYSRALEVPGPKALLLGNRSLCYSKLENHR